MKKIVLSTVLISTVLLGSTQMASAASTLKTAETPVGIEFEKDTPIVPGPYKRVLTLMYKPSALEFGKVKPTGGIMKQNATNIGDTKEGQWIVVNDDRENPSTSPINNDNDNYKGGTWNLTAKMDALKIGDKEVPGTNLTMTFGKLKKYEVGTIPEDESGFIPPSPNTAGVADLDLPANENVKFESDNSKIVLSAGAAAATKVLVKNQTTQDKSGVATKLESSVLEFQGNQDLAGKATSKIVWTLSTGI